MFFFCLYFKIPLYSINLIPIAPSIFKALLCPRSPRRMWILSFVNTNYIIGLFLNAELLRAAICTPLYQKTNFLTETQLWYMKENLQKKRLLLFFLITSLVLTGCSEIGLLSNKNSWLPADIYSTGDFFKVYIVLQISIILISLILGIFLGNLGYIISLALHFIWIVSARDYGFLNVLLLFGMFTIISFLLNAVRAMLKGNW